MDGFDLPRIKRDYDALGFAVVPGFFAGSELQEAQQARVELEQGAHAAEPRVEPGDALEHHIRLDARAPAARGRGSSSPA